MNAASNSPDDLCKAAKNSLKQKDAQAAIRLYEQAIALDNAHVGAHEGLAMVCFLIRDYDRAVELYTRVTRLDPRNVSSLINLGAVLNRKGDYQQAVKTLRNALAKDRRCAEAYYNLGIAQKGLNQLSMAVSAYKEAIRLNPEMAEAYVNLGNTLVEMGNHSQAKLNFQRALQINPKFEKAKRGLKIAEQRGESTKSSVNPFGRLVNLDDAKKKTDADDAAFRRLSPQERYQDRVEVHRLAKEAEQAAAGVLNVVRNEIEAALLEVGRHLSEKHDVRTLGQSNMRLEHAVNRFEQFTAILNAKTKELRGHETFTRGETE